MAAEVLDKSGNVIAFFRDWQQAEEMLKEVNPSPLGETRKDLEEIIEGLKEDLECERHEVSRLAHELKQTA